MKPCRVRFVATALDIPEAEIMAAIRAEKLMATGGHSPLVAKVLGRDVLDLFRPHVTTCPLCCEPIGRSAPKGD